MEQLRDVIAHLLSLAGPSGSSRTVLTKLVYFAELESWRLRGEPLTGVSFYRFHYGAWAPDVRAVAENVPYIDHKWFQGFYLTHLYRLKPGVDPSPLADDVREIIEAAFAKFGRMSAAEIGRLSKHTEPMLVATEEGDSLDLSVVAPRRPGLVVRDSQLARAQAELDLTRRGTRGELDARDREELAAWSRARSRANTST